MCVETIPSLAETCHTRAEAAQQWGERSLKLADRSHSKVRRTQRSNLWDRNAEFADAQVLREIEERGAKTRARRRLSSSPRARIVGHASLQNHTSLTHLRRWWKTLIAPCGANGATSSPLPRAT